MNPNRDLEPATGHHDEMMLHHFSWYLMDFPYYSLPSQAFDSARPEPADAPWPHSRWPHSAVLALALAWLSAGLAVVFT